MPTKLPALFSAEILLARRYYIIYSKYWKENTPKNTTPGKLSFKNEGAIKTFPDKQKLREFKMTRLALQEMMKGVLPAEMKGC